MLMDATNSFDVIIVGAGMAGLTSGAYLAKAGARVLVCEKNARAGGLVGSFERDGFHFDAGARAFENSGVIFPMLRQLGVEMEFIKNEISIGLKEDMVRLKDQKSLDDYRKLLERHFPDNKKDIGLIIREIKKVMKYMDVIYGIDNPLFSDRLKEPDYLLKTIFPWLVRYQMNIRKIRRLDQPINDYLLQFTANRELIDFITQHFFKSTPAFFALSYFGLYLDYSYPLEGTQELPLQLENLIKDNGGFIVKNTAIDLIDLDERTVVTNGRDKFKYRKLVWAADTNMLYDSLKSAKVKTNFKIESGKIRLHQAKGGDSVISVFLAVDLPREHFQKGGPHCFYTPGIKGLSALEVPVLKNRTAIKEYLTDYLETTTYEVSIPNLRNEKLAPANQTGIIISTLMDHSLVKQIEKDNWYLEFKEFVSATIIALFDRTLYPDLQAKVIASSCTTPLSLESYNGSFQGAITGWSFENEKMPCVTNLPQISKAIVTEFLDVYQCGQWSFSPSGVPISIITGKLASDQIISDLKLGKGKPHG